MVERCASALWWEYCGVVGIGAAVRLLRVLLVVSVVCGDDAMRACVRAVVRVFDGQKSVETHIKALLDNCWC